MSLQTLVTGGDVITVDAAGPLLLCRLARLSWWTTLGLEVALADRPPLAGGGFG
jgi:hypothetical protein